MILNQRRGWDLGVLAVTLMVVGIVEGGNGLVKGEALPTVEGP